MGRPRRFGFAPEEMTMAVTRLATGYVMTAVGDRVTEKISILMVAIEKITTGTVTFRDGAGNTIHVTESITGGAVLRIPWEGWATDGFEYDATSAGSAIVRILTAPLSNASPF